MDDFEKGGKVVDGFQEVDKSFNQFQKKHEITNNRGSNIFLIIGVALLLAFSLLFYRFILKKG
jgi:LPXTG-motif cell wall-anchored protein